MTVKGQTVIAGVAALMAGLVAFVAPQLTVAKGLTVDGGVFQVLGPYPGQSIKVVSIPIRNSGTSGITIQQIHSGCSCLEASVSAQWIPAGSTASLSLRILVPSGERRYVPVRIQTVEVGTTLVEFIILGDQAPIASVHPRIALLPAGAREWSVEGNVSVLLPVGLSGPKVSIRSSDYWKGFLKVEVSKEPVISRLFDRQRYRWGLSGSLCGTAPMKVNSPTIPIQIDVQWNGSGSIDTHDEVALMSSLTTVWHFQLEPPLQPTIVPGVLRFKEGGTVETVTASEVAGWRVQRAMSFPENSLVVKDIDNGPANCVVTLGQGQEWAGLGVLKVFLGRPDGTEAVVRIPVIGL